MSRRQDASNLTRCPRCGAPALPYIAHRCGRGQGAGQWLQDPIPCPRCGNVAFSVPDQGAPWRRCDGPRSCGHVWQPVRAAGRRDQAAPNRRERTGAGSSAVVSFSAPALAVVVADACRAVPSGLGEGSR